jgi:hypothetical protein
VKLSFDTHGNEKQKQCCLYWADNNVTDVVYGGSKGSAKSYTVASLIFSDALMYPNTHYFIARKKLTDLRKFTIPTIHEVFEHWDIDERYYRFDGKDNFFELHNQSKVFLIEAKYAPSDPKYMRFGSMQMTRGWIEEAGDFEVAAKNNLAASIGRWKNDLYGLSPKLLQTCNPSKNYLYKDYYKAHANNTLPAYRKFIQALPTDNKMLPEGYIENLKRILTKNERERLLYGNWEYDDDPSVLIDFNSCNDYFKNEHVKKTGFKYITADIARKGRDSTIVRVWHGYVVIERLEMKISKVTESADAIKGLANKHEIPMSRVIADEDGVGGGVVDILNCKGFVNNSKALNEENYSNLKSQCSFMMAKKISNKELYEQCYDETVKERVVEEMEQVKQANIDQDGKVSIISKDKVKENIGRSPDEWDSIMMRGYFDLKPERGRRII